MAVVSAQEYQVVFSEVKSLQENFVALEQEYQRLSGDLQQIALEKQQTQQQHGELALRVQQLEATIIKDIIKSPSLDFLWNSMERDRNSRDFLIRYT